MANQETQVFQRILAAYDGSSQSQRAIDLALSLAAAMQSHLPIFAVIRPPEPATRSELNAMLDDGREHYEQSFAVLRERAKQKEVDVETDIVVGHPAEQIVHRAETTEVDLIVMGRRGVSTFQRWMLGSISERVLRYAYCPVMVVH
jgi:nucleotide-binding universal stress UspA family protein